VRKMGINSDRLFMLLGHSAHKDSDVRQWQGSGLFRD
jgi:hypothetical protein